MGPRRLRARTFAGGLLFVALGALGAATAGGCRGESDAPPPARKLLVETAVVATRDLEVTLEAVGTAYASGQVDIRPQVPGILLEAPFREGDKVEAGQVLARLDDGKAKASLALAEAQLDSAKARLSVASERLERYRRLRAEDLVSREEYATLEAEQKAAAAAVRENEAEVALAARNLEDFTLKAPISGRMGIRRVDTGNFLEAGTVISTLVETDPVEVLFAVPGAEMEGLTVGQPVSIRRTDGSELATGYVRVIDPRIDTGTRMGSVKALVANPDRRIQAGQFVGVVLVKEKRPGAVVVPEDAVLSQAGRSWVFVLREGRAERRDIEPGLRRPGVVEVKRGLADGETLVTRGQHRLADGDTVDIAPAPAGAAARTADAAGAASGTSGDTGGKASGSPAR